MLITSTLRKSFSFVALASVLALTSGCQQEELLEDQFSSPVTNDGFSRSEVIEGQYIVVFKNSNTPVTSGKAGELSAINSSDLKMRRKLYAVSGIDAADVTQEYEGGIRGFAARLTPEQLATLRKRSEVAYVEQDRHVFLGKASSVISTKAGDTTKGNNGKTRPAVADRPSGPTDSAPAPTEPVSTEPVKSAPAPAEPVPAVPAPAEPTPTEPETAEPAPAAPAPTEPAPVPSQPAPAVPTAPTQPAFATITPLAGELVPWNIERVGYGDGTGKTVWIIDSGIDTDHPDLNVDLNRSISLIYQNPSVEDGYGHGTSVAGIIAAKNNGSGMVGVASNATIVALRVFDDAGAGTLSRAINAVLHISNNARPGDVVNMSLGSGMSTTLDNAVKAAAAKGILFAIAAGNSGVDCYETSPARVDAPGVYTVSAIDNFNRLWERSNYGTSVDVAAPGVNVTVTTKGGSIGGGASGTSMAAPHVAGVLLLRGTVPSQGTITGDKDNTPDPIASVR
ncbi:S8 family serine peptidase [Pontibacter toksunensis]|uniref:S8 family serine peptidase n=1 Tax=Pontibacter toksunensis TaxID=1332631 RepID=A0ABW6BNM9_9BACT